MHEPIHRTSEGDCGSSPQDVLLILESLTDGCLALDHDWCFIYVNAAAAKLIGCSRAELLGRNHWEVIPASFGTLSEQIYRRVLREQVPGEYEFFHDSWQKWFSVTAYPTQAGGLSVFFRDITDQKNSSENQRQQGRTFDTLLSNTPDHAYILDPTGQFLYANQALLTLWQKTLAELVQIKVFQLALPAEFSALLEHQIRQVVQTGQVVRDEASFHDANGQLRHYEYIFSPILAADGAVEAIAGSSRDVTERVGAIQMLSRGSSLNALGSDIGKALTQIENLPAALQRCAEAMVQHLDGAFARIWTLAAGENILQLQASAGLYTHLNGPHSRIPVGAFKIGRIAKERRPHMTNDVAHDDQISDPAWAVNEGMVAFAGYPLIVEDRLVGVLALFARHPLAQDILESLESISDSVAMGIDRKRAERVLADQTEHLARSNADLQQFAYITSHDLQEPLRTMSNFSQLLMRRLDGQLDSEGREFLGYIVSGAQRMKILMDSLLSYSSVVNAETALLEPVSLETALHWATANLQTALAETDAVVTHDALPTIQADQVLLVQLLQNLIGNGIKYRKPGRVPHIHLSTEQQDRSCVVAVQDNGIGVEAEHFERIFGVFKRLHGTEIPGAGMGLAICKRIVEKHSGRIWVDSTPGEGSTFYVALPCEPPVQRSSIS